MRKIIIQKIFLSSNFAKDHTKRTKKQVGDDLLADTSKAFLQRHGQNIKNLKLNHTKITKKHTVDDLLEDA